MNCHLAYYSLWGFTIGSSPTPIQKMVVQLREIFLKFLFGFTFQPENVLNSLSW
jgi:hypothetical protein